MVLRDVFMCADFVINANAVYIYVKNVDVDVNESCTYFLRNDAISTKSYIKVFVRVFVC